MSWREHVDDRRLLALVGVLCFVVAFGVVLAAMSSPTPINNEDDGVTVHKEGGPAIALDVGTSANLSAWDDYGSNRVKWITANGDASFASNGRSNATVHRLGGNWLNMSSIDATGTTNLSAGTPRVSQVVLDGEADIVNVTDATVDNGVTDFVVKSPQTVNMTVPGFNSGERIALVSSGTVVDQAMTNSSGWATFETTLNTKQELELVSGGYYPIIDNSTMSPSGGTVVDSKYANLSVDIEDPDFPNDVVTVRWFVDGTQVKRKQISQNTTVSHKHRVRVLGNHTWNVTAVDEAGLRRTSQEKYWETPVNLSLYETNTTSIISTSTDKAVSIYWADGSLYQKTISATGEAKYNLTNELGGDDFIVLPDVPGYYTRPVWHPSLYERDITYLLPSSTPVVNQTFKLRDYSGDFPATDTVLEVQRGLSDSNKHVVAGDYFGSDDTLSLRLAKDKRHCLAVVNTKTGTRRDLGCITPSQDKARVISVDNQGVTNITLQGPFVNIRPTTGSVPAYNQTTITGEIVSINDPLESYEMRVYLETNSGTTLLRKETGSRSNGETIPLDVNLTGHVGDLVRVEIDWQTQNRSGTEVKNYTIREAYSNQHSLLAGLASVPGRLSQGDLFTSVIGLFAVVIITGAIASRVRMPTEALGLIAVALLALFGFVGWVDLQFALIGGLVWTVITGLRRGL